MEQTNIEEELSNNLTEVAGSAKASAVNTTNLIINREKRVRKPKQYDNDYLLYDTSTSINKTFTQINNTNSNLINRFKVGDLVWAKLSGHPWWPCMISNGPDSIQHYRLVGSTHRQKKYVYVEFFGPTIEHAWISESSLIDYKGVNAFKIYAQNQVDQANSKSAKEKLADKFQLKVSLSKRDHWEKAIQEADYSINIPVSERLVLFSKKLNDLGSNCHSPSTDANNNLIDSNEESQMSNGSTGSFKRKLNSETNIKNSSLTDSKQFKFDALEMLSTNSIPETTEVTNEEDEDENNSLTLSKILLDVANSSNTNNMKSELNDYFIEQLTNQPDDLLDEKKNLKEEFDENEEENDDEDDDDVTFNSDDIDEDDEEDTSDENYSDVEKINKKKQSIKPRFKNNNIVNTLNDTKRNDVINAFGLRERKEKKNKRLKNEDLGESPAQNENLESDASTDSYLIYQPDQNNKQKNSINSATATLAPKRTYNKSNQTITKKYKTKKQANNLLNSSIESLIVKVNDETLDINSRLSNFNKNSNPSNQKAGSTAETYLIDRYKYAVRHIRQGLSVEEACNKYRISKGALLKCLSGGTAPRGKKTRLTELEENEIVEWLINNKDLKYNEAIHLVFEQVEQIFEMAKRPNPFHNGKPSMDWWYDFLSRHPQIMASKPEWLRRGKVNDQYIRDVQSGKLRCTKFRRALLSAIQYIRSLTDAAQYAAADSASQQAASAEQLFNSISNNSLNQSLNKQVKLNSKREINKPTRLAKKSPAKLKKSITNTISKKSKADQKIQPEQFINYKDTNNKENKVDHNVEQQEIPNLTSNSNNNYLDRLVASLISDYADISENEDDPITSTNAIFTQNENSILNSLNIQEKQPQLHQQQQQQVKLALIETDLINTSNIGSKTDNDMNLSGSNKLIKTSSNHLLISDDQDDEDYHLTEENGQIEVEENGEDDDEEDDDVDVDEDEDDDEDGQTHITTLNEFA